MTAQKCLKRNYQLLLEMQKKTNVVTFEGSGNSCSSSVTKLGNVCSSDWKDIRAFLPTRRRQGYVVEQMAVFKCSSCWISAI